MMIEDYTNTKKDTAFAIFIVLIFAFAFFMSCKPAQIIHVTDTITTEKKVIQRDSFSYTEPDSISISLLFECDSNNNVLIKALNDAQSKGMDTKYIFKDNRLILTAYIDSMAILHKLIESEKSKETVKHDPQDAILISDLTKKNTLLEQKASNKNKIIGALIALIVILGALYKWFK